MIRFIDKVKTYIIPGAKAAELQKAFLNYEGSLILNDADLNKLLENLAIITKVVNNKYPKSLPYNFVIHSRNYCYVQTTDSQKKDVAVIFLSNVTKCLNSKGNAEDITNYTITKEEEK